MERNLQLGNRMVFVQKRMFGKRLIKLCQSLLIAVVFLIYSPALLGQSFPVQVVPQTIPPIPVHFSEYADIYTTNGPLKVQLVLNDLNISDREVRLKLYFEGNGIDFQSKDFITGAKPLYLEGGMPLVLAQSELAPYFSYENIMGISPQGYGQTIPEGVYQFCFEVVDALTGNRLSRKTCSRAVILKNEPPFLITPRNKTDITEHNPQNIVFQWTPRHINVSNVEYEISLVEIWDNGIDPQAAFLSSPPIFQTTTAATTYIYGPADPMLMSDKNYAWRVQAKAKKGTEEIGVFTNQGYSEIFSFSYAGSCLVPQVLAHEVKGSTNANIFWEDFSTDIPEYTVRYREKGKANEWFFSKTTANQITLWDLKPGTTYEYQLQKKCTVAGSEWSATKQFTTFIANNEASVYECGIAPSLHLTNRDPLVTLKSDDIFLAGDFPITVMETNGSEGRFTGKGYVTIPYLNSIKVAVVFTNVLVNTDKQLVEGTVVTKYDPELKNILDVPEAITVVSDAYDAVADLGSSVNDILKDVFGNEKDDTEEEDLETSTTDTAETQNQAPSEDMAIVDNSSDSGPSVPESPAPIANNNPPPMEEPTGSPSPSPSSPESDTPEEKEVAIEYNGNLYKNGAIVEVPYHQDQPHFALFLRNYPEEAVFNWQVLHLGTDNTAKYTQNETTNDNIGVDMQGTAMVDVIAFYNDEPIKITLKRKAKEFRLVELYAKPQDNDKRLAKSGKPLYLINTDSGRKVDFGLHITPKIKQTEIYEQDISWYYEKPNTQTNLGKDFGKKNIHLTLAPNTNYTTKVMAGNPDPKNKSIDIIWFDESVEDFNFLPDGLQDEINKSLEEVVDNFDLVEKIIPSSNIKIELSPITIAGTKYNEEDKNSRLYKQVEKGYVQGGLQAVLGKTRFTHPTLKILSRLKVVDIGLYTEMLLSFSVRGGVERFKYIENTKYENNNPFVSIGASGCLIAGAEAKLLVAKEKLNFNVNFNGKACVEGRGEYKFNSKELNSEFFIPPVVITGTIKIASKGVLNFELIDWTDNIKLGDKITLGEYHHKF